MKLTDADIARLKAATRWTDEDLQLLAEAGLLDLLQQRDPAAEITEYDRSTTLLGRIFNDLARGGASALANLQGAMALGSGDPAAVQRALEAAARVAEMPRRPVVRQMIEEADAAGGFWEGIAAGLKAASRDPLGAVAGLALESLPAQLPAYLVAILSRRPMVGAGAMGATSFLQEFGSALAEEAAKRGIDPNSPEVRRAVIEALADPAFLANAREHGAIRGAIIGLLDAVAARLAGQMLVPESVAKGPLAREAANIAVAQPAAQIAAGAGGEALAQLATEGKVTSPGEVLAEALGELGGVPVDVAVFGRERIADTIRKAAAEREARQERERVERAAKAQAALGPSEEDDTEAQRRAAIETILPFVPEAQGDPNFFAGWDDATLFAAQERIIRRRLAEMQSPMEGMPVPPDPPPPDAPIEAQKLYAAQMRAYAREVRDFYRRAVAARENALEHQKTFGEPIASTQAAQLQTAQQQPAANVIYQHPALGNIQLPAASPDAEAAQRGLAAVLEHALERQRVEQERQAVMREVLRKFDIAVPEGAQPLDVEELFEREIGTRVRRLAPDIELPKIDRNSSARVAQLRERNNAILRALPEVLIRQKAEARSAFKLADVYRRRIEDQANATIEIEGMPQPKKGVVRDPQAGGEPLGDVNVRFVPVIGNYPVRPLSTARRQTSKGVTYTEYVFEAIDPRTGEPMRDKDGTPIVLRISDPNDVRFVAYKIGPKNKDFISRAKGPADERLSIPRAQSRVARVEDMGDEAAARGELKGAYELGELIGEERDFGVFLARGAHTFEVRFGRRTTSGRWYAVGADQIPRTIRAQLENAARWYMTKQRWMPEPPPQGEGASPGPDQPSPSQANNNSAKAEPAFPAKATQTKAAPEPGMGKEAKKAKNAKEARPDNKQAGAGQADSSKAKTSKQAAPQKAADKQPESVEEKARPEDTGRKRKKAEQATAPAVKEQPDAQKSTFPKQPDMQAPAADSQPELQPMVAQEQPAAQEADKQPAKQDSAAADNDAGEIKAEATKADERPAPVSAAAVQANEEKERLASIIDGQIASDEKADIGSAKEVAEKFDAIVEELTKELNKMYTMLSTAKNKKERAEAQAYQRKFRERIEERRETFKPIDVTLGANVNEVTLAFQIPTPSLEAVGIQTGAVVELSINVPGYMRRVATLTVSMPPGAHVVSEAGSHNFSKWDYHEYSVKIELASSDNIIEKLLRERAALFKRIRDAGKLPLPEPTPTAIEVKKRLDEQFKKALEPYGEKNISWVLKHDKAHAVAYSFIMSELGISYNDLENLYGIDEARRTTTTVQGTEDPLSAAREFLMRLALGMRSILYTKKEQDAHRKLNRKLVILARELGIQHMFPFDELSARLVEASDANRFGQMSHAERTAFLSSQLDEIFGLDRDDLSNLKIIPSPNEVRQAFHELIISTKSSGFDADAQKVFFRNLSNAFERAIVPHIDYLERETKAKNDLISDKSFAREQIPILEKAIILVDSLAKRVDVYLDKLANVAKKGDMAGADDAVEVAERVRKRLHDILPKARARLQELQGIRDHVAALKPATKVGDGAPEREVVVTPDGSFRFEVTFEVVPASTLKHASGELQPRDRTRAGSEAQIRAMAAQLDPDRLVSSRESDRGAPIVDENSVVLSGNGRVAAIKMAAAEFPEKYEQYLGILKGYGFKVEGIDTPILVRRARGLTPEQKRTIAVKSLAAADLRLSSAERAMVDAEKIDHEMLRGLQGNPDGSSFTFALAVRPFFEAMPPTERAEYMDHSGRLTPEGVERIQAAVFARAYGDRRLVELMIEEREEPTIRNALLAVAADWALMREQGDPQYDITKQLIEAISLIRRSRTVPGGIRALLRQVDAFERRDPITELLARLFYNSDMSRLADQRTMIVRLQSYAASVLRRSQAVGDLFKDAPTTPQQILEAILRATQQGRGVTLYSNPIGPLVRLTYHTVRDAARFMAGLAAPWMKKAAETPAGKWLREAIKDTKSHMLSTGGPSAIDRALRLLSSSTHEYARWIAEQYGSQIAIEKIVNVMGPRPGTVDIGDTYEEEVEREGTRYIRRWDEIVREARGAGVTDEEIVKALTRTGAVSDKAKRYAQKLRNLFDEMHKYAVDAGIEMGYRADYFTRVLDPAKVSEDYEGFIERAASLYQQNGFDQETAKQAARELAHVIVTGGNYGVFDLHGSGSPKASIFRQREFGPEADRVLAPYYDRNLDAIGARYISALVKRAAFARRFGDDSQRLEEIFEEIRQELETRGKGAIAYTRLRNEMIGYLRAVLGIGLNQSAWRVSALIRMAGTLMMLEKAVLASLIEPLIVAGRSGSLRDGLRTLRDTMRALRKSKRPPEIVDLALEAGIIAGDIADAILAQRWFGSDPLTRVESDVLTAYFRRIGLEQWTNASRIAATGAAVRFLNRIFSRRTSENEILAREFGLDYDRVAAFWEQNGLSSDPLYASLIIARSRDPIAENLRRAVHRFVNDVVISARRGDRPRWANTALGAVIFQFSAYSWGYGRRVLMRPLRLSQSGMPHMAMARYLALAFVPMLVAMAVMAYGIEDIKDELYGLTDKYYYGNRLTPVAKWERAVSRSGLFAGYDPIYQLMGSTRFEQDAAKLVFGPVPGIAVRGLGALRDVFFANAPETRTAERNVIRWMYDFFFEPTVNFALTGVQSPIAKGLASFITVYGIPSLREPAVSAIAGPLHKPPRPIKGVLESVKLPQREKR